MQLVSAVQSAAADTTVSKHGCPGVITDWYPLNLEYGQGPYHTSSENPSCFLFYCWALLSLEEGGDKMGGGRWHGKPQIVLLPQKRVVANL